MINLMLALYDNNVSKTVRYVDSGHTYLIVHRLKDATFVSGIKNKLKLKIFTSK